MKREFIRSSFAPLPRRARWAVVRIGWKPMPRVAWACFAAVLLWLGGAVVRAGEIATFDFPLKPGAPVGAGMLGAPVQSLGANGEEITEFFPLPTLSGEDLFVTLIFAEDGGAGPAVSWVNDFSGRQTVLAADLSDGVTGWNQRTLRIPRDLASQSGRMVLSGPWLKLLRVRFDRTASSGVFVAADQEVPDFIMGGKRLNTFDLMGGQPLTPPDVWYGDVLDAPLQDEPLSLEGNLEFVVPLSQPGDQGLFRAEFLGLPLAGGVDVWINGQMAGTLIPESPSLTDPGYLRGADGEFGYAGWRPGALVIPQGALRAGENSIIIETPDGTGYIRDAAIEVRVAIELPDGEAGPGISPDLDFPDPLPPTVSDDGFVPDLIGL